MRWMNFGKFYIFIPLTDAAKVMFCFGFVYLKTRMHKGPEGQKQHKS